MHVREKYVVLPVTVVQFSIGNSCELLRVLFNWKVSISPPFSIVVIDFAGHFNTKCVSHWSRIYFKSYLGIFVWCATRAVHFESLSSFLKAFDRFRARCGPPCKIYSDNGSTFIKAKGLLSVDWDFGPPPGSALSRFDESCGKIRKTLFIKGNERRCIDLWRVLYLVFKNWSRS